MSDMMEHPELVLPDRKPDGEPVGMAKRLLDLENENARLERQLRMAKAREDEWFYPSAKKHHLEMLCAYLNDSQKTENVPDFVVGGDVAETALRALVIARKERDEAKSQLAAHEAAVAKAREGCADNFSEARTALEHAAKMSDAYRDAIPVLAELDRRARVIASQADEISGLRALEKAIASDDEEILSATLADLDRKRGVR